MQESQCFQSLALRQSSAGNFTPSLQALRQAHGFLSRLVYLAAVPGIFAAIFLFQKYHSPAGWQKRKKPAIAAVAIITAAVIIFELMLSGIIGGKWES